MPGALLLRPRVRAGLCAIALLLGLAGGEARAEGWEATPFLAFRIGGSVDEVGSRNEFDFDGTLGYGLSIGRAVRGDGRVEGTWSHQSTSLGSRDLGLDIDYLHVAGVYEPQRDRKVGGFVLASAGLALLRPESTHDSSTGFSGSIGGGGKFVLNERLAIRLDARVWAVFTSSSAVAFCDGGCLFAFSSDALLQFETSAGLVIGF